MLEAFSVEMRYSSLCCPTESKLQKIKNIQCNAKLDTMVYTYKMLSCDRLIAYSLQTNEWSNNSINRQTTNF